MIFGPEGRYRCSEARQPGRRRALRVLELVDGDWDWGCGWEVVADEEFEVH